MLAPFWIVVDQTLENCNKNVMAWRQQKLYGMALDYLFYDKLLRVSVKMQWPSGGLICFILSKKPLQWCFINGPLGDVQWMLGWLHSKTKINKPSLYFITIFTCMSPTLYMHHLTKSIQFPYKNVFYLHCSISSIYHDIIGLQNTEKRIGAWVEFSPTSELPQRFSFALS